MSPRLTQLFVFLFVLTANTVVFVSSQSTVGQHGVVKYQQHCISNGRCRYVITLPPCQQDEHDCVDSSDDDQPILTQLLQIVTQQSLQIQELTDHMQNQSFQIHEQSHQIEELAGLVQNQSVQIQELSQLVQNLTNEERLGNTEMRDCSSLSDYTGSVDVSGVGQIYPFGILTPISVYCEYINLELWTVIQQRLDGSVNFTRNWEDYKNGFGNIDGEYWLGNDNIHALTTQASYKLRIDLEDWDGTTYYAEYDRFWIEDEAHNYILRVGEYSGTAGDSLIGRGLSNGQSFSTYDRDNDNANNNCAAYPTWHSGWWFNNCGWSNLNGPYLDEGRRNGIYWQNSDIGHVYTRKKATMKILKNQ